MATRPDKSEACEGLLPPRGAGWEPDFATAISELKAIHHGISESLVLLTNCVEI
jgi:hypothetical protein